jgi:lipid A 3-O-deacylase
MDYLNQPSELVQEAVKHFQSEAISCVVPTRFGKKLDFFAFDLCFGVILYPVAMLKKIPTAVLVLVFFCFSGSAQETNGKGLRTFWISWENDHFVQTDRGFTNGLKLTWISGDKDISGSSFFDRLAFVLKSDFRHFRSYSLRQDMFTPDDLTVADLLEQDRPYAGFLAFEIGAHSVSPSRAVFWGLSVGIVGPLSLAEQAQKMIHSSGRAEWPEGWQHQLENELAVGLQCLNKWKQTLIGGEKGLGLDLIPHAGGGLGNVYTYVHSGLQVRLGWNLPLDFGVPLLCPGGSSGAGFSDRDAGRAGKEYDSFYLFAVGDIQTVLRNIFLDGNSFRDSHSVKKENFAAYLQLGLGAKVSVFHVTLGCAAWTRLFETQRKRQIYAIMNIYYSF